MRSKSINCFLMEGTPIGPIKCTVTNWHGTVYRIPRTELDKCRERKDLKGSGVYLLFGIDEEASKDVVYIGQSGDIFSRLQQHKRDVDKDYWNEAIVFTTSNNLYGATEINWLEHQFVTLAQEINRYKVKNIKNTNHGNPTEEKKS